VAEFERTRRLGKVGGVKKGCGSGEGPFQRKEEKRIRIGEKEARGGERSL